MIAVTLARHHWRSLIGTFLALAVGVLLLATTLIIFVSSSPQVPLRYAAAPVLVSSQPPGSEPERAGWQRPWTAAQADALAADITDLPGVQGAVVDHTFHAQLVVDGALVTHTDTRGRQGHNWSSAALGGSSLVVGAAPSEPDEVVVGSDLGLAVGDRAQLLLATESRTVRVSGVLDAPGVLLDDASAARAAAGPRALGLVLDPGADPDEVGQRVRRQIGDTGTVLTGADRDQLETEADSSDRYVGAQFLVMLGVITGFVSIFVIATTFAFVVAQRRRELGLLRCLGATPGQVRRMTLVESVVVAVPAGVVGASLGALLAGPVGRWMVDSGMQPQGWTPHVVLVPAVAALGLGLLIAVLGAWSASRRAARIRPMEALREAAVDDRPLGRGRLVLGLTCVLAAVAVGVLSRRLEFEYVGAATTGAACAALLGAALLAPTYLPRVIRGLTVWSLRSGGPVLHLLREGSTTAVRRVASTLTPVLLTMGLVGFVTGMVATMSDTLSRANQGGILTSHAAAPRPGSPGVTDPALTMINSAEPELTMSLLTSWLMVGPEAAEGRRLGLNGLDATMTAQLAGAVREGNTARLDEPDTVAISTPTVSEYGIDLGDSVPVSWPDGSVGRLEVVAVLAGDASAALLPRDRVRAHDVTALAPVVYVDGLDPATINPELAAMGVEVVSKADYEAAGDQTEEELFRLFTWFLLALAIGYTGLAIANTLVMATADRRTDFAVLRQVGALRSQILRLVAAEAAVVAVIGVVLGTLCAVPAVAGISRWLAADLDVPARLVFDWPAVGLAGLGCLVMAVLASLVPARRVMTGPIVEAARATE
ncbi:MAG: ABC transporter permease [Propionibacteriaceae bacterium]